jgi:uncharacterized protein YjbI with pentapeptide repeats
LLADIAARIGLTEPLAAFATATPEQELAQQGSDALRKLGALPDPSLMITPQELERGDFDLTGVLDVVEQINVHTQELAKEVQQAADDMLIQAAAMRKQLLQDVAAIATPETVAAQLDTLKQQACKRTRAQITGFADLTRMDKVLTGMTPSADTNVVDAKTGAVDSHKLELLKQDADAIGVRALRLSRLKSPEFCGERPQTADERKAVAASLRETFIDLLQRGETLNGRDFAGADLSDLDLSGLDLSELMLEHADVSRCRFHDSNLFGAVLTGATVDATDFSGADLRSTNLSAIAGTGARFDKCRLDTAVTMNLRLPDSSWRGATLRDNTLLQCELQRAVFSGAQLERVALIKCELLECDFSEAGWLKVNGAQSNFRQGRFARSSLEAVSLLDVDCTHADFTDAMLRRCLALGASRFVNCNFTGVMAVDTGWRNLDFTGACFRTASFSKADFANAVLRSCDLREACFNGSLMSGVDFREVDASAADFYRATLRKADFTGATLERANLRGADLFETLFHSCKLKGMQSDNPLKEEQYV